MKIKSTDLFYCADESDKEYHIQIVGGGGLYDVECQWGRRSGTLQAGTKATGVPLEQAEKVYAKVVREKVVKGYKEVVDL